MNTFSKDQDRMVSATRMCLVGRSKSEVGKSELKLNNGEAFGSSANFVKSVTVSYFSRTFSIYLPSPKSLKGPLFLCDLDGLGWCSEVLSC